tara:strand:- start:49628 stop:50512 length:885 start_codon:yes stop_codon:yes gene_type:complete
MKKYLLPLLMAGAAFAQSTTSVSTSETTLKESIMDKLKKNTSMSYFSQMAGPGLKTPLDTNSLDGENNPEVGSPISIWNQVSLRYQMTKDVRFVINGRFEQYLGRRLDGDGKAIQNTEGLNPVTGFAIRHKFTDKFSYSGGLNTILANVEKDTQEEGLVANPGGFQTFMYKVNDKLTVGSWVSARAHFYDNAERNSEQKRWDLWIAPFAEYSIADNTYLRGWIGQDYDHDTEGSFFASTNRGNDAGLGVDFGINKHFGVYPYIEMSWADRTAADDVTISTDSATIGAWFYGSIF